MPDSEDEDDHSSVEETCRVTGFFRAYIENGQILNVISGKNIGLEHVYLLMLLLIIYSDSIFLETCWWKM